MKKILLILLGGVLSCLNLMAEAVKYQYPQTAPASGSTVTSVQGLTITYLKDYSTGTPYTWVENWKSSASNINVDGQSYSYYSATNGSGNPLVATLDGEGNIASVNNPSLTTPPNVGIAIKLNSTKDATITVTVRALAYNKNFFVVGGTDGSKNPTDLKFTTGTTAGSTYTAYTNGAQPKDVTGAWTTGNNNVTFKFSAEAGVDYTVFVSGSKMGFQGLTYEVSNTAPIFTKDLATTNNCYTSQTHTLSVASSSATSFSWYSCSNAEKADATIIAGANESSYNFIPSEPGTYYLFCRATNAYGSTDSKVATITVTDFVPVTSKRSWDLTKGSTWGTEITNNSTYWGATDKGRSTLQKALTNEELPGASGTLSGMSGLYFTLTPGAVLGVTSNFRLQHGSITVRIPGCNVNDTITVQYCSANSSGAATITSSQVVEGLSTTSTSDSNTGNMVVKTAGDVTLSMSCSKGFRLQKITVKPFVLTAPVVNLGAFDVENSRYSVTLTSNGASKVYYRVGGEGEYSEYTSAIDVDANAVLDAYATAAYCANAIMTQYVLPARPTVKTPVISVSDYNVVSITTATEGASIYYTLDGSTPTISSTNYTTPFTAPNNSTIKAIAVKFGYNDGVAEPAMSSVVFSSTTLLDWSDGSWTATKDEVIASQNGVTFGADGVKYYEYDATVDGNDFHSRLQWDGGSWNAKRMLSFKVSGACNIIVYGVSNGSDVRNVQITTGSAPTAINQGTKIGNNPGGYIETSYYSYNTDEPTTVYIANNGSNYGIYGIKIVFGNENTYTTSISSVGFATLALPYATTIPAGVTAYTGAVNSAKTGIVLTEITDGVIPANTGVVIAGAAGTYTFEETTTAGTAISALAHTAGAPKVDFTVGDYVLTESTSNEAVFAPTTETYKVIPANKAYVSASDVANSKALTLSFYNDMTGVDNITIDNVLSNGKFLKNGHIVIIKNGKKVNAIGQVTK